MPDLGFLSGQPGYVIIAVVLIAAAAYVIVKVVRRSGDQGDGREGLAAVDSAAEYLAEKAIQERDSRRTAETERDRALADLAQCRTELTTTRDNFADAQRRYQECQQRAAALAAQVVREEARRRGEHPPAE